jgi:hypothetical protein
MFILEDIFKPNCEKKICCLYCNTSGLFDCPNSCVKDLTVCENCFYIGQKFEEAKKIQKLSNN